jgi:putative phosphoribosyl transferase
MITPLQTPARQTTAVRINVGSRTLPADLAVPSRARALVIFAHGPTCHRLSPATRFIADALDRAGLATLVGDLLSEEEEAIADRTGRLRFDMTLLASRLVGFCAWGQAVPELRGLAVGLFGASSGGGAALFAAAQEPRSFRAVVTRGGRPDLAGSALRRVLAPTLLIVGERDERHLNANHFAMERMLGEVRLEVVAGATHRFEEPGALERVASLATDWFSAWLTPA